MRLLELLREAAAASLAGRVSSSLILVVVALTCAASLLTVGQQAAAERRLEAELGRPAARTLTITDDKDSRRITTPAVAMLSSLDLAEHVVAFGTPQDVVNGALGEGSTKSSIVVLAGETADAFELTRGRMPRPGAHEALISEGSRNALGMSSASGVVEADSGQQWNVVGSFRARTPFEQLDSFAIVFDAPPDATYRQIQVTASSVSAVSELQAAVLAVLAPKPGELAIQSPISEADVSAKAQGQLTSFGRSLLLLIFAVSTVFVAVVVLADTLIHRRDLGRRRTLGITRTDLVLLVALRATIPAALGAVVATAGILVVAALRGTPIPPSFAIAVAFLATLASTLAAIAPAIFAAWRDPVAVMRVA